MTWDQMLGTKGSGPCRDCGQHSAGRWPGDRCRPCWDLRLDERRTRVDTGPTALYRLHSADGYLVYIGISVDPKRRFKEHRKTMPLWSEVDPERTTIEWLDCGGRAAEDIEHAAILAEFPWYNSVGLREPDTEPREPPPGWPPEPDARDYLSRADWWAEWSAAREVWWAAARDGLLNPEERAARDSVRREPSAGPPQAPGRHHIDPARAIRS